MHGSSSTKLSVLGPVQLTQGAWVEDSASSTCMLADCGLGFSLTDSRRFRHHCRHCGLLVCAACFSADVESASGEGWLRICVVCAVALADEAVEQPDAQVEEIATVVHEMIQRTERRRDAERAREEGSLINAVKRNVQVVIDQRREKHNEWWQEWHNGGQNAAMLKQTTKPCVKCEVPIVSHASLFISLAVCSRILCAAAGKERRLPAHDLHAVPPRVVVVLRERAHRLHLPPVCQPWLTRCTTYVQDYRKGHAKLCRHSGMTHFA